MDSMRVALRHGECVVTDGPGGQASDGELSLNCKANYNDRNAIGLILRDHCCGIVLKQER